MIANLDAEDPPPTSDICVVGAGPAGLALASVLDQHGVDAIVLDAGGDQSASDPGADRDPDAMPYPDVATTRRRGYGGTAALWGTDGDGWTKGAAMFRPLESHDFTQRAWIPHSGWPIQMDDLEPYYRQASRLAQLGTDVFDLDHWDPDNFKRLPIDDTGFQTKVFHLSHRDVYINDLVNRAKTSQTVRLIGHAPVTKLIPNRDGTAIVAARTATANGAIVDVRANQFVLATGGIENTRLMLELDDATSGAGSDAGRWPALGKTFMERPHGIVGIILPTPAFASRSHNYQMVQTADPTDAGPTVVSKWHITPTRELLEAEQLAGFSLSFFPAEPAWLPDDMNQIARQEGHKHNTAAAQTGLHAISFMAEQYPNSGSQIRLSERQGAFAMRVPTIARTLRPEDHKLYLRMQQMTLEALEGQGLGQVHIRRIKGPEGTDSYVKPLWNGYEAAMPVAHHHMGTTRMHHDPQLGVVDGNNRCHGVANLHIAGTSVFPTSGCYNPTMTLIALSLRLADHLRTGL